MPVLRDCKNAFAHGMQEETAMGNNRFGNLQTRDDNEDKEYRWKSVIASWRRKLIYVTRAATRRVVSYPFAYTYWTEVDGPRFHNLQTLSRCVYTGSLARLSLRQSQQLSPEIVFTSRLVKLHRNAFIVNGRNFYRALSSFFIYEGFL